MSPIQRLWAALDPWLPRLWTGTSSRDVEVVRIVNGKPAAGVRVDADTALKNATVWACIRYLSSTVAQLPWRVMAENDKGPLRVPSHPVQRLLSTRPNPEMTAFAFRETLVGWATRYGNAVAEIVTDARNLPVALWPLHPSRVEFKRNSNDGEMVIEFDEGGGNKRQLSLSQVYHVRGFGEGPVGLDVISYAAESIGWAQATEIFGATFFGNGANPSGFLFVPHKLSPQGYTEMEERLRRRHGGVRRANKTMIVDGVGSKYEKTGVAPDDAQFIETRQHQVEEICRWFGVPPHKVMHLLRATFSNIEHQSIEVVVDAITPWALRLEQEADYKLFGANRQGYYTKLDLKGLLRGDFKSRQEGLQIQRRNGVINANTWRRLEDMDEIGPEGDVYIVEGNMTTLDQVGQQQPAAAAPQETAGSQQDGDTSAPAVDRARRQAALATIH